MNPRDNSWNVSCWVTACSIVSQILKEKYISDTLPTYIDRELPWCINYFSDILCARKREIKDTILSVNTIPNPAGEENHHGDLVRES